MKPLKVIFAILVLASTSTALETDTSSCGDVKFNLATTVNAIMCVLSQVSATSTNLGEFSTSAGQTSSSTSSNSTSTRAEIMREASPRVAMLLNPETTDEEIWKTLKNPAVRGAFFIIYEDKSFEQGPPDLRALVRQVMDEARI